MAEGISVSLCVFLYIHIWYRNSNHISSAQPGTQRCHRWLYFLLSQFYFNHWKTFFFGKFIIFNLSVNRSVISPWDCFPSQKISVHVCVQNDRYHAVICLAKVIAGLNKLWVNHVEMVHALCSRCGLHYFASDKSPSLRHMFGCKMIWFFLGVYCFTDVIVNNPSALSVPFVLFQAVVTTPFCFFSLQLSECFSSSWGFSLSVIVFEGMWF